MPSPVDIQIRVLGGAAAKTEIVGVAGALDRMPESAKRGTESVRQGFFAADLAATNFKSRLLQLGQATLYGAIGGGIAGIFAKTRQWSQEIDAIYEKIGRPPPGLFNNLLTGWNMILGRDSGAPEAQGPIELTPEQRADNRRTAAREAINQAVAAERAATDPVEQTLRWAETLGNVENRSALIVQHYRELVTKQKDITAAGKLVDAIGGDVSRAAVRGTAAYASASAEMQARQEQTRLQQRQLEQLEAMRRALEGGQTIGVFSMDGVN